VRIAEIAPTALTVPPQDYGGIESVVSLLADGLTGRGHAVTLFATEGSSTDADLISPVGQAVGTGNVEGPDELCQALAAYLRAGDFDVIHDHTVLGAAVGAMLEGNPPVFHTLHGPWTEMARRYYALLHRQVGLVAISEAQRALNPAVAYAGTVHNGIDLTAYPYREGKEDYLLFVGRSNPEKGPELAVDVARAAGLPLKMVVKRSEPAERRYWDNVVGPRLTGREEIVDGVGRAEKAELFSRARATLFPIRWDEPFGLVMVESMACGTPVVASRGGAATEVVEDGVTGFLRHDVDDMVEALSGIDRISPEACRARVAERFSEEAMVSGYERLFRQAVGGPSPARPPERAGAAGRPST